MKRLFTLLFATICMTSVFAQDMQRFTNVSYEDKVKYALNSIVQSKSELSLPNNDFSQWTEDSVSSMTDSVIYFDRPEAWAPVYGFLIAYFTNAPEIPLGPIVINNDTAARIFIADNGFGTDISTVLPVSERALSFSAKYKFNGDNQNPASFEVYATKFDAELDTTIIIGIGGATVEENTNGNFEIVSSEIYYFDDTTIPDSLIIFATYLEGAIGSELIVDDFILSNTITGIDKSTVKQISVYPNPSKDKIQISLKSNNPSIESKVEFYDISGKLVKVESMANSQEAIDISDLYNGIYFLRISNLEGVYSSKLLVE